jgi:polyhydroxybutyrate depolymerase
VRTRSAIATAVVVSIVSVAVGASVGATAPADAGAKVAPKKSTGCRAVPAVAPGEEKVTTTSGGVERWYFRHVPPGYDGTQATPVVLDLHGYAEGATVAVLMSKLGALGDQEGFITITPEGTGPVPRWDTEFDSADVAFIGDLLDELGETLCVDERRVFVTGLSNGAFMTSSLACVYADRIAAAAPIAGVRAPIGCDPARPVPAVVFHGTADEFVAFDGGFGSAVANLPNPDGTPGTIGTPTTSGAERRPSIPETVAAWAKRNGCTGKPTEREVASDVTLIRYRCPGRADVAFYRIEGGGHSWPGSEFSRQIESVVGPTTFSISANDVMWRFFEHHPLRAP